MRLTSVRCGYSDGLGDGLCWARQVGGSSDTNTQAGSGVLLEGLAFAGVIWLSSSSYDLLSLLKESKSCVQKLWSGCDLRGSSSLVNLLRVGCEGCASSRGSGNGDCLIGC